MFYFCTLPTRSNQKFEEANKFYYEKNYQESIKLYDEVLTFGDYANAYNNRGKCYQALGDEAKAQADFKKAKELGYNG